MDRKDFIWTSVEGIKSFANPCDNCLTNKLINDVKTRTILLRRRVAEEGPSVSFLYLAFHVPGWGSKLDPIDLIFIEF